MKNICTFLSLIALVTFFSSCQEETRKKGEEREVEKITYEAPKQIISLEEADSLYENYKNRRIPTILEFEAENQEDEKPFVPTQFVSFDIETLKTYLGYVEQEAKKGGTTADSLRIYFGNYGNLNRRYPNKNTVFLLPTAKVNGDYGGIFINGDGKAMLVRDWLASQQSDDLKEGREKSEASFIPKNNAVPNLQGGTSLTLNRGNGGPPPKTDY